MSNLACALVYTRKITDNPFSYYNAASSKMSSVSLATTTHQRLASNILRTYRSVPEYLAQPISYGRDFILLDPRNTIFTWRHVRILLNTSFNLITNISFQIWRTQRNGQYTMWVEAGVKGVRYTTWNSIVIDVALQRRGHNSSMMVCPSLI